MGKKLAALLNAEIDATVGDDVTRASLVQAVAAKAECDVSTINRVLAGGTNCPTAACVMAFAHVLELDEARLYKAAKADGCEYERSLGPVSRVARVMSTVEKADGDRRVRTRFVASTATPDRMGDVVDQDSWDLGNYKQNPVILWAHDYSLPPVGRAVFCEVVEGQLEIEVEWDTGSELGATVARQFKEGFLSAGSVGFRPSSAVPRASLPEEDPRHGQYGYVFYGCELLEFSAVPVPANAEALAAKGLPTPNPSNANPFAQQWWVRRYVRRVVAEQSTSLRDAVAEVLQSDEHVRSIVREAAMAPVRDEVDFWVDLAKTEEGWGDW